MNQKKSASSGDSAPLESESASAAAEDSSAATEDSKASEDSQATASKASRRLVSFGQIALVVITTAAVVAGVVWWLEAPIRKAERALADGEFKYALFEADEILANRPNNTQALSIRARALMGMQKDPDEVLRIFDEIQAATGEEMLAWAQACLMKSLWSDALPLLEQSVEMLPTNAEALYQLSICRIQLGRQKEALESAERLTQLKGNEARAYVLVGSLHGDLGNMKEASDAMASVLKFAPDAKDLLIISPEEFFLQYGQILLRAGQPEDALDPLKRSVALQPSTEAFLALGNAASQLGRQKDATQAWIKSLEYSPFEPEAREALANVALQDAKFAEALDWLKPLADSPEMVASTAYLFQRAYAGLEDDAGIRKWTEITAKLRKEEQFLASLDAMISDNPDGFWARAARTHNYASEGNWGQAEALLGGLLKDAPGERFIIELADAVRRRSELPPIENIPITQN